MNHLQETIGKKLLNIKLKTQMIHRKKKKKKKKPMSHLCEHILGISSVSVHSSKHTPGFLH